MKLAKTLLTAFLGLILLYLIGYIFVFALFVWKRDLTTLGLYPPQAFFLDEIHKKDLLYNADITPLLAVYRVKPMGTAGDAIVIYARDYKNLTYIDRERLDAGYNIKEATVVKPVTVMRTHKLICQAVPGLDERELWFTIPCTLVQK